MDAKRIAIIGGGISGLTILHYLKLRCGESADITLFERESSAGGTIRSLKEDSCLFEWGPNGFLSNQPATLQLIEEVGLTGQTIEAKSYSRGRFVQIQDKLHALPLNPLELIRTPLLSLKDKWSLVAGVFRKGISTDLSIHDYVSRRFSPRVADNFVDPFIRGVYAGDIKRLHMASAFPKLKRKGRRRSRVLSFEGGMGQLISALEQRYKKYIRTDCAVSSVPPNTDVTIIAAPAYAAAQIVDSINPSLARLLDRVPYAPVAVTGLLFDEDSFKRKPEGFGYLIPSAENKEVLGVLNESNVFDKRCPQGKVMVRVMSGGMHHPGIINDDRDTIIGKAIKEIDGVYGLKTRPLAAFVKLWPKAIPQYDMNYPGLRRSLAEECAKTPGLYLCANYLDGVSLNDCVYNSKSLAAIVNVQNG
jgi:oxygen-dependent protoporphyrinogen oxidase